VIYWAVLKHGIGQVDKHHVICFMQVATTAAMLHLQRRQNQVHCQIDVSTLTKESARPIVSSVHGAAVQLSAVGASPKKMHTGYHQRCFDATTADLLLLSRSGVMKMCPHAMEGMHTPSRAARKPNYS
jgi:hypothetical protein